MGNATTTLNVVNSTAWRATVTAQVVSLTDDEPRRDIPVGGPITAVVPPGGQATMLIKREQPGDVRCNVTVNFGNGAHSQIRINVKPKDITLPFNMTNTMVTIGDRSAPVHQGAGHPPPAAHVPPPAAYAPPPAAHYPPPQQHARSMPPPAAAFGGHGTPAAPRPVGAGELPAGARIALHNQAAGGNLRIKKDGTIDCRGKNGPLAQFTIDPAESFLRLRSVAQPNLYLAVRPGGLASGPGGKFCHLVAYSVGNHVYTLRCAHQPDHGVGFTQSGDPVAPAQVKNGPRGQFNIQML